MKYWSDKTKRIYDTEEQLHEAELDFCAAQVKAEKEKAEKEQAEKELAEVRKARAAEIDEARKKMVDAQKHYRELIEEFVKDYHSYHYSLTTTGLSDLFDTFLNWF